MISGTDWCIMDVAATLGIALFLLGVDAQSLKSEDSLMEKCPIMRGEELELLINTAAQKLIVSHLNNMNSQLNQYRMEMNEFKNKLQERMEENNNEVILLENKFQKQELLIRYLKNIVDVQTLKQGVRLVNGSSFREGRVEVYKDGAWGTVCDDMWDFKDAAVTCNQLFGLAGIPYNSAYFGSGNDLILMDDVNCTGTESSLGNCNHKGNLQHNCQHREDAGVVCMKAPLLRLSRQKELQGRVEVYLNNAWGTICDTNWDYLDARVVCRSLGYGNQGLAVSDAVFGEGNGRVVFDKMYCKGKETSLSECSFDSTPVCSHAKDAGVICRLPKENIRLFNGTSVNEGFFEVLINRKWEAVCNYGWDNREASVACRSLGYSRGLSATCASTSFGESKRNTWLTGMSCTGKEDSIIECPYSVIGSRSCATEKEAGVICFNTGKVRIVNGKSEYEGRLEISLSDSWQSLCSTEWDKNGADVTCRSLGYIGGIPTLSSVFGEGIRHTCMLDGFSCVGSEASLFECLTITTKYTTCRNPGVVCYNELNEIIKFVNETSANNDNIVKPYIYINGNWMAFCKDGWDDAAAKVSCRNLGYLGYAALVNTGKIESTFEKFSMNVECTGIEATLANCKFRNTDNGNCNNTGGVGVKCYTDVRNFIRLVNGTSSNKGRVEVFIDGEWGTVCDDGWDDNDAAVVCRSLGYSGISTAHSNAYFGRGTGNTWLDDMKCVGTEFSIFDCTHGGYGIENCGHNEDAGVTCT